MSTPEESAQLGGPRLRPISEAERKKLSQYEIDFRFVREVERLERDGRAKSRNWLEKQLEMGEGVIAEIRRGRRGVLPKHIALLKMVFNADYKWILFGGSRDADHSAPYLPGRGKLDVYPGYFFTYRTPAGWKCGPRAETRTPNPDGSDAPYSAYFPSDPDNALWQAHPLASKHAKAHRKPGDEKSPAVEGEADA